MTRDGRLKATKCNARESTLLGDKYAAMISKSHVETTTSGKFQAMVRSKYHGVLRIPMCTTNILTKSKADCCPIKSHLKRFLCSRTHTFIPLV